MKVQSGMRKLARWGRAILLPIGDVDEHVSSLVLKTGKELNFEPGTIQNLETETKTTLHEMGINK